MVCCACPLGEAHSPVLGLENPMDSAAVDDGADSCLSIDLLRYIRDEKPTETQLMAWLGPSDMWLFPVLRKAGLLLVRGDTVALSPEYLSADGKRFSYELARPRFVRRHRVRARCFNIDENNVIHFASTVCSGPTHDS